MWFLFFYGKIFIFCYIYCFAKIFIYLFYILLLWKKIFNILLYGSILICYGKNMYLFTYRSIYLFYVYFCPKTNSAFLKIAYK